MPWPGSERGKSSACWEWSACAWLRLEKPDPWERPNCRKRARRRAHWKRQEGWELQASPAPLKCPDPPGGPWHTPKSCCGPCHSQRARSDKALPAGRRQRAGLRRRLLGRARFSSRERGGPKTALTRELMLGLRSTLKLERRLEQRLGQTPVPNRTAERSPACWCRRSSGMLRDQLRAEPNGHFRVLQMLQTRRKPQAQVPCA